MVKNGIASPTTENELDLQPSPLSRYHPTDGLVPATVAASRNQDRGDGFGRRGHTKRRGHQLTESETLGEESVSGMQQCEHSVCAQRPLRRLATTLLSMPPDNPSTTPLR